MTLDCINKHGCMLLECTLVGCQCCPDVPLQVVPPCIGINPNFEFNERHCLVLFGK